MDESAWFTNAGGICRWWVEVGLEALAKFKLSWLQKLPKFSSEKSDNDNICLKLKIQLLYFN